MHNSNIRILYLVLVTIMIMSIGIGSVHAQGPPNAPGAQAGPGPGVPGGMPGGQNMTGMQGPPGDMTGAPEGFALSTETPEEIEAVINAVIYVDGNKITVQRDKVAPVSSLNTIERRINRGTITAIESQESGIYVKNGGSFTIENSTISKPTGPFTYGMPESGEMGPNTLRAVISYGLNSVVLSTGKGSKISLNNVKVNAIGLNSPEDVFAANPVYATFDGVICLNNVEINADGSAGHGVDCTSGGTFYIDTAEITTRGSTGSALATDNPGGNIYAMKITATVWGDRSAGIYCDGGSIMDISESVIESKLMEGMVICNDGSVTLNNVKLTGRLDAVKVHFRRGTGNAKSFISDSTLVSKEGGGIVFDGGWGDITIDNTKIKAADGKYLVRSQEGSSDKGTGEGILRVRNSKLAGNIGADEASILKVFLEGTTLKGAIEFAGISLGADSKWDITADSRVIELKITNRAGISASKAVTVTFGSSGTIKNGDKIGNVTFFKDSSLAYPEVANMGMEATLMGGGMPGGTSTP